MGSKANSQNLTNLGLRNLMKVIKGRKRKMLYAYEARVYKSLAWLGNGG